MNNITWLKRYNTLQIINLKLLKWLKLKLYILIELIKSIFESIILNALIGSINVNFWRWAKMLHESSHEQNLTLDVKCPYKKVYKSRSDILPKF